MSAEIPTNDLRQVATPITEALDGGHSIYRREVARAYRVQRKHLIATGPTYYGHQQGPHDMPAWKTGHESCVNMLWTPARAVWRDIETVTEKQADEEERTAAAQAAAEQQSPPLSQTT